MSLKWKWTDQTTTNKPHQKKKATLSVTSLLFLPPLSPPFVFANLISLSLDLLLLLLQLLPTVLDQALSFTQKGFLFIDLLYSLRYVIFFFCFFIAPQFLTLSSINFLNLLVIFVSIFSDVSFIPPVNFDLFVLKCYCVVYL